jgi:hypothetical protein
MRLTYQRIKNQPKVLISLTTLKLNEFEVLSQYLEKEWQLYMKHYTLEGKIRNRGASIRVNNVLPLPEDRLLFILYHLKGNPLQELMAITFEMTQPQVSVWIKLLSKLLAAALERQKLLPKRKVEQLKQLLEGEDTVLLDATERQIQRPMDYEVQKEYFSGKKNSCREE